MPIQLLQLIVAADTWSLINADIKEFIIRGLKREEKNYRQPIQMYCYSRYSECSLYSDSHSSLSIKLLYKELERVLSRKITDGYKIPSIEIPMAYS